MGELPGRPRIKRNPSLPGKCRRRLQSLQLNLTAPKDPVNDELPHSPAAHSRQDLPLDGTAARKSHETTSCGDVESVWICYDALVS